MDSDYFGAKTTAILQNFSDHHQNSLSTLCLIVVLQSHCKLFFPACQVTIKEPLEHRWTRNTSYFGVHKHTHTGSTSWAQTIRYRKKQWTLLQTSFKDFKETTDQLAWVLGVQLLSRISSPGATSPSLQKLPAVPAPRGRITARHKTRYYFAGLLGDINQGHTYRIYSIFKKQKGK